MNAKSNQSEKLELWDEPSFFQRMRGVGEQNYYDKHPFHLLLGEGRLPMTAIQCWIRNRFYYQRSIPVKDAFILTNAPRAVRRIWLHRIIDHDGIEAAGVVGDDVRSRVLFTGHDGSRATGVVGGILSWVRLDLGISGEAPGGFEAKSGPEQAAILAAHEEKLNLAPILPGVKSAVDSYVDFARTARWELAVASSLTEMFAPDLMSRRLASMEKHYPAIPAWSYDYFRNRPPQARRDQGEAWSLVARHCATPELQRAAVAALEFKCGVLWKMLDAIMEACGNPAL